MISILQELPPDINTGQDMFLVQFLDTEAGANAIRVVGAVVAHVANAADIPEEGRVGRIRRAQPPVSGNYRVQPKNIYRFRSKTRNDSYLIFEWRTTTSAPWSTRGSIH